MNRQKLEKNIIKSYKVQAEYPWIKSPTFAVFRHQENKKWFAVVMTIEKSKLGFKQEGKIDVINLKCDPNLLPSMLEQEGVFPAYHMSKRHWLTIIIEEIAEDLLNFLLALSYDLTSKPKKVNKQKTHR